VEFGVVHLGPIAQVAVAFLQSVQLLVAAMVDCPSASYGSVLKLGAVGVDDDCVIRFRSEPFFVELLGCCCFVGVRGRARVRAFRRRGGGAVLQFPFYQVFAQGVEAVEAWEVVVGVRQGLWRA